MIDKTLPILPIVRPTFPPLESIADRFSAALKSGQVTNGGRYVEEFEAALTEYLGVPTIAFSSGMAALIAMLMVEGVEGSEVICPSFTFCATPHAIRLAGGKVVFADIDPKTLTIDPMDAAFRHTPRTKCTLAVDVFGICSDYHALGSNLLVDSAPAFGSLIYGKPTGCHGNAQIFSFHATKPFSSMEGGCLCTNDPVFLSRAKKIRNFGQPHEIGLNGKMTEVCALIGLEQLKGFGLKIANRNGAANYLSGAFEGVDGLTTINAPDDQLPAWTYYPILIDEAKFGMSRHRVVCGLADRGIMTRLYYPAMHLDPVYADCRASLPVTERVASEVIALPLYADMTVDECARIGDAIRYIQQCGS